MKGRFTTQVTRQFVSSYLGSAVAGRQQTFDIHISTKIKESPSNTCIRQRHEALLLSTRLTLTAVA